MPPWLKIVTQAGKRGVNGRSLGVSFLCEQQVLMEAVAFLSIPALSPL